MVQVGLLGVGTMGSRIAHNLLAAGHDLTVFDIDDEATTALVDAGARPAESAVALALETNVVMMCLPGPSDVIDVVDEIEPGLQEDDVVIDLTTSIPSTTNVIADRLADQSVNMLGAPVSGGRARAENGTLAVMVGGREETYEQCKPLFEAIATNVFHVGENPRQGHGMKLVNNYLSFVAMICTSEATVLGEQVGLDLETMIDVFNASSGRNTATSFKFPEHIATGSYDMEYEMRLVEKDMQLLMSVAENTGTPFVGGGAIRQIIAQIRGDIGPEGDYTEIYKHFQRTMGDAKR